MTARAFDLMNYKEGNQMTLLIKTLATVAAGTVLAANVFAQSAKEVLGTTPYVVIENEPPPKLVVDPPVPDQLARGVVEIQYRVENLHIVPVFGAAAEWSQYSRCGRATAWPAQGADRISQQRASSLYRLRVHRDGDVHSA